MEQIIKNLLASNSETIKKATFDLQEAYKHPETISTLCQLAVSAKEAQVRQYSAVLLRKRLSKSRNWKAVQVEQQNLIKEGMLNALIHEQEKSVRNAIAQFVGVLLRYTDDETDPWMTNVLGFIFTYSSSSDPKQSELGSSIFATLADVSADQFVPQLHSFCEMFTAALIATEASGNLTNPVIYNIILGMGYLVPFILGHNIAEQTYQKSIPSIIKSLRAFAIQPDVDQFVRAFDILDVMADYTPKLLTSNIQLLLNFCLEISNDTRLDNAVRVKTVAYIGWLVRLKKKVIIKQKLIEPIIQVVFNLISTGCEEGGDPEDEEDYFTGEENSSPMATATQTMDLLALNVPPDKLIPPLLALLEPALQGENPLPRKASYLCMAVIAEGCSETICNKYLETMLNIIKVGITDSNPIVRNAAFFALGQFSEHLQPDITKYAPEILPILFDFLHQLCNELRNGGTEPKHIDRMFYALETYCENLENDLVPHLPLLMDGLFQALNPNRSVHLRELALSAVSAAANAVKENMLPYFQQLIAILQTYLVKSDNDDIKQLRPEAIYTLSALARTIGKENFMPLATDTMNFALTLLSEIDDPDVRRAIYNLIASLAEVVNESMGTVYPKIMDRIFDSILSNEEIAAAADDDETIIPSGGGDNEELNDNDDDDGNDEIDIEDNSDKEIDDDNDNNAGYGVENSYLEEKEEAILALKEFAEHSGVAFIPYLEKSYQNVYKMIDHPQEDIRKISIDALIAFILALFNQNDLLGVTNAVTILIPKLSHIIHEDEDISVVMSALAGYAELLEEIEEHAVPTDELREIIFDCIQDVLLGKIVCQYDETIDDDDEENEESEFDEAIVEGAGNILPLLGKVLSPDQFAICFNRVYHLILAKLEKAKKKNNDSENQRSFAYETLAECFKPLQKYCAAYFDILLPIMIDGITDEYEQARKNAVFGVGELVLYAGEKSHQSYPKILNTLSHAIAKETIPDAVDNICGAIARLILTNFNLVPLQQVIPVLMQNLPLKEEFTEYLAIFECFKILYLQNRNSISDYIEKILSLSIHILYNKEFTEPETSDNALALFEDIRKNYPDKFNAVVTSSSPDVASFLQIL